MEKRTKILLAILIVIIVCLSASVVVLSTTSVAAYAAYKNRYDIMKKVVWEYITFKY